MLARGGAIATGLSKVSDDLVGSLLLKLQALCLLCLP